MGFTDAQKELAANSIVLIVDDVPGNLELLGSLLSEAGFRVAVAINGSQGIAVATRKPPDLILMDVNMPGVNGYEACEKLKQNSSTAHIPVLFLTAHKEEDEIIRGFEAGGLDYVTKPFKAQELLARIITHVELKKSRERIIAQNRELQNMNEKLSRSEENLRQLNSMKDKFFSILAHDLKNPVASFYQTMNLILSKKHHLEEDIKINLLESLQQSASNLCYLLDNILTWANTQTGCIKYNPALQAINPIARRSVFLHNPGASQKNITINMNIAENIKAYCDENMVSTIIRNLISNAIKFTGRGGTITLSAHTMQDCLEISVSDTGVGIEPSRTARLFRNNEIQTTTGTENEKGTGIGLSLCKEFIDRHEGKIEVRSEPGKGTTISFTLPLKPEEGAEEVSRLIRR